MRIPVILAMLACSSANAATWVVIEPFGDQGFQISIDTDGIAQEGELRKAWVKWEYTEPRLLPRASTQEPERYFVETLEMSYYHCQKRKSALVRIIHRGSDGKIVSNLTRTTEELKYAEEAPDSLGEIMLEAACSWTLDSRP